jgi:hypothetical protein
MTASKTARLGLMRPVGPDAFLIADFVGMVDLLDANPGYVIVANAASRPTNYTAAQHGQLVHQTDYGIVWSWYQPSSGTAGFWKRVGNVGLLGQSAASGLVSTTNTAYATGVQVAALTVTVPGGRPIQVGITWDLLGNTYEKTVISWWENNVRIFDRVIWGKAPTAASSGSFVFSRDVAPSAALSLATKVTVSSYNAAPANGGGTTSAQGFAITIWET